MKRFKPKSDEYWRRIIDSMPPPPAVEYDLVIDLETGDTIKIERYAVFKPTI